MFNIWCGGEELFSVILDINKDLFTGDCKGEISLSIFKPHCWHLANPHLCVERDINSDFFCIDINFENWFCLLFCSEFFPRQHEMRWKFVSNSIKSDIYCVESAYNAQDSWRSSDRMSSNAFLLVLSDGSFCQRRKTFTSKPRLVYLTISHLRNTKWSWCVDVSIWKACR